MSLPIRSLPEADVRIAVALPSRWDGAALVSAFAAEAPRRPDAFLTDIFVRLLAIGVSEAQAQGETLDAALGLGADDLEQLATRWAPHPLALSAAREAGEPLFDDEEQQVRDLLATFAVDKSDEARWLVAMVARRAMRPNHLWQDLGLADRGALNDLLRRFFPDLHAGNTADMKWKKYFYRRLCEMEGFVLCTAPSCRECSDFDRCFGAEDGQSLLARARLATETLSDS